MTLAPISTGTILKHEYPGGIIFQGAGWRWELDLARWGTSIEKARQYREQEGGFYVWRAGHRRYKVKSKSLPQSAGHQIYINSNGPACDCQGHRFTGHCFHSALLAMRLLREARAMRLSDFAATREELTF